MTALALALSVAMRAFVPPAQHAPERPDVTEARYDAIAEDAAAAAEARPVVEGSAYRTGLVLVSIASYEGAFARRVDECRVHGGTRAAPAWGLWQLTGRRDLCGNRVAQALAALEIIEQSIACGWGDELAVYTIGRCGRESKARWRWRRASAWWTRREGEGGLT